MKSYQKISLLAFAMLLIMPNLSYTAAPKKESKDSKEIAATATTSASAPAPKAEASGSDSQSDREVIENKLQAFSRKIMKKYRDTEKLLSHEDKIKANGFAIEFAWYVNSTIIDLSLEEMLAISHDIESRFNAASKGIDDIVKEAKARDKKKAKKKKQKDKARASSSASETGAAGESENSLDHPMDPEVDQMYDRVDKEFRYLKEKFPTKSAELDAWKMQTYHKINNLHVSPALAIDEAGRKCIEIARTNLTELAELEAQFEAEQKAQASHASSSPAPKKAGSSPSSAAPKIGADTASVSDKKGDDLAGERSRKMQLDISQAQSEVVEKNKKLRKKFPAKAGQLDAWMHQTLAKVAQAYNSHVDNPTRFTESLIEIARTNLTDLTKFEAQFEAEQNAQAASDASSAPEIGAGAASASDKKVDDSADELLRRKVEQEGNKLHIHVIMKESELRIKFPKRANSILETTEKNNARIIKAIESHPNYIRLVESLIEIARAHLADLAKLEAQFQAEQTEPKAREASDAGGSPAPKKPSAGSSSATLREIGAGAASSFPDSKARQEFSDAALARQLADDGDNDEMRATIESCAGEIDIFLSEFNNIVAPARKKRIDTIQSFLEKGLERGIMYNMTDTDMLMSIHFESVQAEDKHAKDITENLKKSLDDNRDSYKSYLIVRNSYLDTFGFMVNESYARLVDHIQSMEATAKERNAPSASLSSGVAQVPAAAAAAASHVIAPPAAPVVMAQPATAAVASDTPAAKETLAQQTSRKLREAIHELAAKRTHLMGRYPYADATLWDIIKVPDTLPTVETSDMLRAIKSLREILAKIHLLESELAIQHQAKLFEAESSAPSAREHIDAESTFREYRVNTLAMQIKLALITLKYPREAAEIVPWVAPEGIHYPVSEEQIPFIRQMTRASKNKIADITKFEAKLDAEAQQKAHATSHASSPEPKISSSSSSAPKAIGSAYDPASPNSPAPRIGAAAASSSLASRKPSAGQESADAILARQVADNNPDDDNDDDMRAGIVLSRQEAVDSQLRKLTEMIKEAQAKRSNTVEDCIQFASDNGVPYDPTQIDILMAIHFASEKHENERLEEIRKNLQASLVIDQDYLTEFAQRLDKTNKRLNDHMRHIETTARNAQASTPSASLSSLSAPRPAAAAAAAAAPVVVPPTAPVVMAAAQAARDSSDSKRSGEDKKTTEETKAAKDNPTPPIVTKPRPESLLQPVQRKGKISFNRKDIFDFMGIFYKNMAHAIKYGDVELFDECRSYEQTVIRVYNKQYRKHDPIDTFNQEYLDDLIRKTLSETPVDKMGTVGQRLVDMGAKISLISFIAMKELRPGSDLSYVIPFFIETYHKQIAALPSHLLSAEDANILTMIYDYIYEILGEYPEHSIKNELLSARKIVHNMLVKFLKRLYSSRDIIANCPCLQQLISGINRPMAESPAARFTQKITQAAHLGTLEAFKDQFKFKGHRQLINISAIISKYVNLIYKRHPDRAPVLLQEIREYLRQKRRRFEDPSYLPPIRFIDSLTKFDLKKGLFQQADEIIAGRLNPKLDPK